MLTFKKIVITNTEDLKQYADELSYLADNSFQPNPFYHPLFLEGAIEYLGINEISLCMVLNGTKCEAMLPFIKKEKLLKLVPFLTALNHNYCFLNSPLYSNVDSLGKCIYDTLNISPTKTVNIPSVPLYGRFIEDLRLIAKEQKISLFLYNLYSRPGYNYSSTGLELKSSSRGKNKLEKKRVHLFSGSPQKACIVKDPELFIEKFLKLEAAGWKGKKGNPISAVEGDKKFFSHIISTMHSKGKVQLFRLGNNQEFALSCSFIQGNFSFRFKTCYDEDYSKFSPGALLENDIFVSHFNEGFSVDGCCSPWQESMNRVYPHKLDICSAFLVAPSNIKGKGVDILLRAMSQARKLKNRFRK
jgi:hypothetical protein